MNMAFKIRNGLAVLENYGEVEVAVRGGKLHVRPPELADFTPKEIGQLDSMGWVAERDDWHLDVEQQSGR